MGFKADNAPVRSESGVGALMPWADSLWAVTYNSHMRDTGSGLGLYRIDESLKSERVDVHDGTHANRLIHAESNQCFIGPYVIDSGGKWRRIPELDAHRLTATMRHLSDPANRVYYQTMEGLLLEMDVRSLKPRVLFDVVKEMKLSNRPHFKGGCTAQDRVVVANNGFYEYGEDQAGLFEFDGKTWRRLSGKPHMDVAARQNMGNVIFATGWDEASVLFWALVNGQWQRYRLPKASQAFSHAWQTEWMRIREVETEHYLVDIQGSFFELQPIAFLGRIWGVKPICQHLRTIPDYCSFRGLLAVGGNETTPNQDNNPVAGQPQSGVWFGKTDDLWSWGRPAGWGGPWWRSPVRKGAPSDPYLMTGYGNKMVHCSTDRAAVFDIEIDFMGSGEWKRYERLATGANGYSHHIFPTGFSAHWIRFVPQNDCQATAVLFYT
ncbi:MAG: hypothetical protein LAQ30_16670 [Acidobacteriia bacterium]|nr:hypothetical protein [Terriglobia bacterium]